MKRDKLLALADRVEAATGADRELDIEAALANGWIRLADNWFRPSTVDVRHHATEMPRYTASIDAALTLYINKPAMVSTDPRKVTADALRQRALAQETPE